MRFLKTGLLKIVAVNFLVFLALLVLAEAVGQGVALLRPAYDVLFLKPDPVLGWREVPGLRWTWAGWNWYAADYSVDVQTNRAGFRDIDREYTKPAGVKRVALLGDSFIEAVQVPFEKTGAHLLEQKLNASRGDDAASPRKWEVLDFGISSFGVGQYLLTWEQHASRYAPDYVVVFVAKFIMDRTIHKYEQGGFQGTADRHLWIRPTFRVDGDTLIREPASDFQEFARLQDSVIKNEFDGRRSRRRTTLVTLHYGRQLYDAIGGRFDRWWRRHTGQRPPSEPDPNADRESDANIFATNLKVLEELARQTAASNSVLVVADASRYFGDDTTISTALQELCARSRSVYVPVYKDLIQANANGISTRWRHDGHFNTAGDSLLADALYRSLLQERPTAQ